MSDKKLYELVSKELFKTSDEGSDAITFQDDEVSFRFVYSHVL